MLVIDKVMKRKFRKTAFFSRKEEGNASSVMAFF